MSLYEILEEPVIVALDAGSLKLVAQILMAKYSIQQIRFYADNDCVSGDNASKHNTGVKKTKEAAKAVVNAIVLYPMWKNEENKPIAKKVDWNDVYCEYEDKVDLMRKKIEMALKVNIEHKILHSRCKVNKTK